MNTVVIYGPPGCGKAFRAVDLMFHHGCSRVQEEWDGESPLLPGTLALTNVEPPYAVDVDRIIFFHAKSIAPADQ